MKKILFVCLGNICRSPMAEEVFRQYIVQHDNPRDWHIDSAGIGSWHVGDLPDHRMRRVAEQHGY
ncbi:MAG: low molecular weight phosphotyrosine protein phosphatase, partial [Bacteroidaceae bacterium]|nr:low molecular weight phosphotyrosine protein phosphatase [Bacteroidaceae bacterium]